MCSAFQITWSTGQVLPQLEASNVEPIREGVALRGMELAASLAAACSSSVQAADIQNSNFFLSVRRHALWKRGFNSLRGLSISWARFLFHWLKAGSWRWTRGSNTLKLPPVCHIGIRGGELMSLYSMSLYSMLRREPLTRHTVRSWIRATLCSPAPPFLRLPNKTLLFDQHQTKWRLRLDTASRLRNAAF